MVAAKRIGTGATVLAPVVWGLRHARSAAVSNWAPPTLPGRMHGPLYARSGGSGDRSVMLLHGLVSSGDLFGAPYDRLAEDNRLVVPDLLGFGRSLDPSRRSFSAEAHLDALDTLARGLGLFDSKVTVGAHSMGSALALMWAGRHPQVVDRVVCWGAPIYSSRAAASSQISGSAMTRLFVMDTGIARRVCALSCQNRVAAGWITAAFEPGLPIPVARAVSLHTWPAYRDSIRDLVIEPDWPSLLQGLTSSAVQTELVWGSNDSVGDQRYAADLSAAGIAAAANPRLTLVDRANHHLPMTHPALCIGSLAGS